MFSLYTGLAPRRRGGDRQAACAQWRDLDPDREDRHAGDIPILPELQATLDAGPTGDLAFIVAARQPVHQEKRLATCSREACKRGGRSESQPTACARRPRRARREPARPCRTGSDLRLGGADGSLYTHSANRRALSAGAMTSCRGPKRKHLFPHPIIRCGRQSKNHNEIKKYFWVVRSEGLEPPRFYSLPPQGSASTNSATSAWETGQMVAAGPDQRRRCNKSMMEGQGP